MIGSIIPMSVFVLISLLYFIVVYNSGDKPILDIIYLILIIGSQLAFAIFASKSLCGTIQLSSALLWGIMPWIMIFLSLFAALKVMPGWKAPFSNTFGYGIIQLLGVKDVFNSLMKSNFKSGDPGLNKIAENIYEDHSILINELTPDNFDEAIKRLKDLFDTKTPNYLENVMQLKKLVRLKDEISRFIWYILTGILTISVSNMGIASSKCVRTPEQIKAAVDQYHNSMDEAHKQAANEKKKTVAIIRD